MLRIEKVDNAKLVYLQGSIIWPIVTCSENRKLHSRIAIEALVALLLLYSPYSGQ
jgi:hypothetical protein